MKTIKIDDIKYNLIPVADENKTWTDPKTGLEWEYEGLENEMNFAEALEYAEKLGKGWRLPTDIELLTLIDRNFTDPACREEVRENLNIESSCYWSSATLASNTNYAWSVGFCNGYVSSHYKNYRNYVRCVRSGK